MTRRAFSLIELLVAAAIVAVLASMLFPVLTGPKAAAQGNAGNLKKIAIAVHTYGGDFDDRIILSMNGPYLGLQNLHNGQTSRGYPRTDMWPLILMPYLGDRALYVDPDRGDPRKIYGGPPLRSGDAGYDATANTYRNQNRLASFGFNYAFLSPLAIPASKMSDHSPTDFSVAESHAFEEALEPAATVMFVPSARGWVPTELPSKSYYESGGFSFVNPPGMWGVTGESKRWILFSSGAPCGGDWCGDASKNESGRQSRTNFNYMVPEKDGNNVAFLDGHVHFMTASQLAAGTNYLSATPQGEGMQGGAIVTDKSAYLWNLNEDFYGQY